jgi:hypothetical protein
MTLIPKKNSAGKNRTLPGSTDVFLVEILAAEANGLNGRGISWHSAAVIAL